MEVNHRIIIGTVVIMASGAYHVIVTKNGTLTGVMVGGYLLALLASLIDLIGGQVSNLLGWLLLLAAGGAALTLLTPVANAIAGQGQSGQGQSGGGHRTVS